MRPIFSALIRPEAPDEDLVFARNVGAERVFTWLKDGQTDRSFLIDLRKRVADAGLELYNAGNIRLGKNPAIHLGLPGRDRAISDFKEFIRNLAAADIRVSTFTWEPDQVWSSDPGSRRGARVRTVDADALKAEQFTHGREFGLDELWDNFAYFMREMVPVLESEGVRLALHPNDPPVDTLGGVPCLINSGERYRRAFEIAGSPALGMEFCTGCWLEGGREGFGDIEEGLREFVREGRVLIVHFRNVTSPLPRFEETFLDDGYGDMEALMRILAEEGYSGSVTPDHVPEMGVPNGRTCAFAYAFGSMHAIRTRVLRESRTPSAG